MKLTISSIILTFVAVTLSLTSCKKNNADVDPNDINDLVIPATFNFATTNTVELIINDFENGARYDIYTINSTSPDDIIYTSTDTTVVIDDLNQLVASGFILDGSFKTILTVPSYHKYIFIMRGKDGLFYGENVEVSSNKITYNFTNKKLKIARLDDDILYSVNGSNTEIQSINLGTGQITQVGNLPFKSIANAADKINNRVYAANKQSPFQLGYYDLSTNQFTTVGNFSWNFPRMDYNPDDGLLYISKGNKLYKVDPTSAQILQTYKIVGLQSSSYCDVAFAPDGSMYIGDKIALYSAVFAGNNINVTRLSDNTLPQKITCLAVGSNGHLYTSTGNANGKIIDFDPNTGSWSYFSISGNIKINDFGIIRSIEPSTGDTDGDGVPDDQDDYPDDSNKAFNNYFPGENTWASMAFEDLWPGKGDFDFNDLVLKYNFNQITNSSNKVVEIKATFNPVHEGATLINGFAFQLPVSSTAIESVTGYNLTGSSVTLNTNGTIANHTLGNIIVFDQTEPNIGSNLNIVVEFGSPIDPLTLGSAPYNPYLIIDQRMDMEIHLSDMDPTSLADQSYFGTQDDTSDPAIGRYYKTANNLPWAINIVYDFVWPLENREITQGYLKFGEWAESGGSLYADWYKDLSGYRNNDNLDIQ
jgi:LruC domain-containing protein